MKPSLFKCKEKEVELIILTKSLAAVAKLTDLPWKGEFLRGDAYDYTYDVIIDGEFMTLHESDVEEIMQTMKFVKFL